jgi:hypothetical protein
MKKLALLLFVAVLLAGCQTPATPQPTPAPVEALAGSVSDLIGVWGLPAINSNLEIKADGTYRVVAKSGDLIDFGDYTFDAGKITWANTSMCHDKPATYQVYVTTQDGKPVSLRFQVVGSDPCESRQGLGVAPYQNP